MEIPDEVLGVVVGEGELYFFTSDCPIGIKDHIHVCIKHHNKYLFLSTCSSQTDTAFRLAKIKGWDLNTFPVFAKNDVNKFKKDQTYIDCNRVLEISEANFGKLLKDNKVYRLDGKIDERGLRLIANGIKLSTEVERRIQNLF